MGLDDTKVAVVDGAAERTAKKFTDNMMPGHMRGVDFARIARGNAVNGITFPGSVVAALQRVPISLVTGTSTDEAELLTREGVLQHVMGKPPMLRDVSLGVHTAVRRAMGIKIPM